jgi:hypothetical protein
VSVHWEGGPLPVVQVGDVGPPFLHDRPVSAIKPAAPEFTREDAIEQATELLQSATKWGDCAQMTACAQAAQALIALIPHLPHRVTDSPRPQAPARYR